MPQLPAGAPKIRRATTACNGSRPGKPVTRRWTSSSKVRRAEKEWYPSNSPTARRRVSQR